MAGKELETKHGKQHCIKAINVIAYTKREH